MIEEARISANPATNVAALLDPVRESIARVIVGKAEATELLLIALLCEGHVLLEDVPGVGKTLLAKSLARTLGCGFRRIQCTPDLLPSDITGVGIYDQRVADFVFHAGPIFTNVVLVDEINRATPRTQAALLEAMEERQVTAEGETRPLPRPFLVLATQNPIELEGTFPLPEAQLDRFLLRVRLGYPTKLEEATIIRRFEVDDPLADLRPVIDVEDLLRLSLDVRRVHLADAVLEYAVNIVHATRNHPEVEVGASPRATVALTRAARARAALQGRAFVLPDDIKALAPSVLTHRLSVAPTRQPADGATSIISECLDSVPAPVELEEQDGR
ncbi:MAG: AAA family ATPase [Chloroflexota bacterium]